MRLAIKVQDSARIAPRKTREVKIGFRGNFGVKKSPRNTVLSPPSISDVLFAGDTKWEVKKKRSLYCPNAKRKTHGHTNDFFKRETQLLFSSF